MFGIIAIILFIGWLLGFFVFHISSALIHLVVVVAVVLIIVHFMTGGRRGF